MAATRIGRQLRFYVRLYRAALLSRLEYRLDMAISIVTSLLTQASVLAFYGIYFSNTTTLEGWEPPGVLLLFGMVAMTLAVAELCFNGIWSLPGYMRSGRLDRVLISPARSLAFLLVSQPQLHGLGNLLAGIGMVSASLSMLHPPAVLYLLLPLWVISAAVTYTGVLVSLGALSFVLRGPQVDHLQIATQLLNASRYPLGVYPPWLRFVLLFILPLGVGTHVPGSWLRGEGTLWAALVVPPAVAAVTSMVAALSWEVGTRRYQSTGS